MISRVCLIIASPLSSLFLIMLLAFDFSSLIVMPFAMFSVRLCRHYAIISCRFL